jgi:hypothetical protein
MAVYLKGEHHKNNKFAGKMLGNECILLVLQ